MNLKIFNSCKIVILILIFSNISSSDALAKKIKLKGEYHNLNQAKSLEYNSQILSQPIVTEELKDLKDLDLSKLIKIELIEVNTKVKNYKCFKLSVTNDTDRPIIFFGDEAYLTNGAKKLESFEIAQLFKVYTTTSYEFKSAAKSAIPAAITVGAYPAIKDILDTKKPFLDQFGLDELRRKEQFSSFLERVVYSNESSSGRIYFIDNFSFSGSVFHLPIKSLYNQKDSAEVQIKI